VVSRTAIAEPNRQYRQNRSDIEAIHDRVDETNKVVKQTNTKLDSLTTEVAALHTDFTGRFDQITARFDELAELLDPTADEVSARQRRGSAMRTPLEKKLSSIDGQMAEVLGILRSKPV
jgi:hypothetical protein